MRMIGLRCTFAMFFLLLACPGWGAEVSGRSSTQALWYTSYYNDHRQLDLAQYLRLGINKIDQSGKFAIYGYGRGTQELINGDELNGRLYYLYGEYRDLYDKLDIRIGRQFVNLSADTAIIDGAEVVLKNVGPVGFSVIGGRDVVFGIDGEIGHEGDYALGVAAFLAGFRKTDLDVSWFRKWDQGDVSRDIIGATFKQYLLDRVKAYGNARYDITSEVFNELLGGMKYFPNEKLVFTGEYYESYPTFDATSIFSVFAVNKYWEAVFRTSYTLNDMMELHAGYNRQEYGDDGEADVVEAGFNVRPIDPVLVTVTYDHRNGYPGKLDGGILEVMWDPTRQLQLAAGMNVDAYTREGFHDNREGRISQKYWLGARYRIENMSLSVRVDDDINEERSSYVKGRVVFNYDF